jgi:hypothetical protein
VEVQWVVLDVDGRGIDFNSQGIGLSSVFEAAVARLRFEEEPLTEAEHTHALESLGRMCAEGGRLEFEQFRSNFQKLARQQAIYLFGFAAI